MDLKNYISLLRPAIESAMESIIQENVGEQYGDLRKMLTYHLGWEGEGAGKDAQGKRIRPLLVLLCAGAVGGDWQKSVPAACAVELVHNFSLIHDDIQDNSRLRRGRPTVWSKWGIAQAINAGDFMFTLAFMALSRLDGLIPPNNIVDAIRILSDGCASLTRGQFLDLEFEKANIVTHEDYYRMIEGKTAALLSVCTELGCITAGVIDQRRIGLRQFGYNLGMAFQVVDDWLGIWGDIAVTGKSNQSDLVTRKKTLPVIFMLENSPEFRETWFNPKMSIMDIPNLLKIMNDSHAKDYIQYEADRFTRLAIQSLEECAGQNDAFNALVDLTSDLLSRNK